MLAYIWAGGEYGSALQAAALQGCLEIVQLLLKQNADVNLQGNEPTILELHAYLYWGRWTIWKCTPVGSISGPP
jgi:urea transporter